MTAVQRDRVLADTAYLGPALQWAARFSLRSTLPGRKLPLWALCKVFALHVFLVRCGLR